jgi:DNA-binding NtrC family response regulator
MADLGSRLGSAGWTVECAENARSACASLDRSTFTLGIFDFSTIGHEPWDEHEAAFLAPNMEWIALLPPGMLHSPHIRKMVARSFFDYHTLPLDMHRLMTILGHADGMLRLRAETRTPDTAASMTMQGNTARMRQLVSDLGKAARTDVGVLITGETGTGKELAARTLHHLSHRAEGPFVVVDCGALAPSLVHAELFGHEKGAFTGAEQRRIGRIEAANGGTLLLDEIGELPMDQQVNLLRFLQESTIQRIGSSAHAPVDVRVVAATNVGLEDAVRCGRFREDLYYRLNVITLEMPPLRERLADIEELAKIFFDEFSERFASRARGFAREALRAMRAHEWPGNVRELRNRIQQAVVMTENRLITAADLRLVANTPESIGSLQEARRRAEREAIEAALAWSGNNRTIAARKLGVSRITLYRLLARHGLDEAPLDEASPGDAFASA